MSDVTVRVSNIDMKELKFVLDGKLWSVFNDFNVDIDDYQAVAGLVREIANEIDEAFDRMLEEVIDDDELEDSDSE